MAHRAGFVAIAGRPNAGKSTLVNMLVGQKVAIVSPKPQTTRSRTQGILNRADAQIVLIDTPGLHKPGDALGRQMMEEARQALDGVDIVSLIVDASAEFGRGDRFALDWVKQFPGPVFLLLNKIDRVRKLALLPMMDRYRKAFDFAEIFPISALSGEGCLDLASAWTARLPEHPPYFPANQLTDQPERFLAAEIIREKAILETREEVPYATAVVIEDFSETPGLVRIRANIYAEREGQKAILIGRAGSMMKKIGTAARKEIERLLGRKVFLELFVRVRPRWREDSRLVRQLDWRRQLEELAERAATASESEAEAEPEHERI